MSARQGAGPSGGDRAPDAADLIARCLDGVASEDDVARLDRLVAGDPEAARALAQAARIDSRLEVLLRGDTDDRPAARASAAPRSGRRRALVAAAGAAAAAAALVVAWLATSRPAPVPTAVAKHPLAPSASAGPPAPAAPPPGSGRRLRFADGSSAELSDGESRLETRLSTPTAIDLVLAAGGARLEVVHSPGRRFRIWIDSTYVEVIGTAFTVQRLTTGVRVSVQRGLVKVVSAGSEMRLSAGAAEMLPLPGAEAPPTAAATPPPETERRPRRVERARHDPREGGAAGDESGALLRASEDARRGGRPEEAAVLLRRLLDHHARDPRAPYAAFMLGRVLLEELARPREAAAAFASVESLAPETPLVQDALAREVESWARAGDSPRAQLRARAYLTRYPAGQRIDEVRRYSHLE